MIRKHTILVLSVAVLISAGIWIMAFNKTPKEKPAFSFVVFKGYNGWGYDILVNDSLFIHQESVPAMNGSRGFAKKEQAEQTAQLIINKMKKAEPPTVTTFELGQIIK